MIYSQTLLRGNCDRCDVRKKERSDEKEKENDAQEYSDDDVGHNDDSYRRPDDPGFKCNICGSEADFIVQLEIVKERSNYNIMESVNQMPFYLCKSHEYVYKKMQNNIDLKDYFSETVKENQ